MTIIAIVLGYFALLLAVSRLTAGKSTNDSFFRADRSSPWPLVAFGMIGASISGITFISVPGMVLTMQMTYLQTCLGFIAGYVAVAFVLLPLYYRLGLTSIYAFLGSRLGKCSHLTGSWFFLLSKTVGSAAKFYVVCIILQRFVADGAGVPFWLTASFMVLLIWLYTRRGGIKTLVWTDSLQTLCLLAAAVLIVCRLTTDMHTGFFGAVAMVADSSMSRIFVFDDWLSTQNFWKQFVSGAFIVIVMTGLDQDMMQKNLTCRSLGDAQKDMCCYGVLFVPVNLLFLSLGVLTAIWYAQTGAELPSAGDSLLPGYVAAVAGQQSPSVVFSLFVLGIVAASFSSADSALTSLTTIYCVDIARRGSDETLRRRVHLCVCAVFVLFILLFDLAGTSSLINTIYIIVSYTYGPLLGMFAFGLLTTRSVRDRLVPAVAVASPFLSWGADAAVQWLWDYRFGYELLLLNGALTFAGLWLTGRKS